MKTYLFILLCSLMAVGPAFSQNGKLISKTPYVFADSTLAKIEKLIPSARSLVANVDFFKITYHSDGLQVTGFMTEPKKSGNYPCLILNRGGNREFGAWDDETFIRYFGEMANWGYVVVGSFYRGNCGGEGKEEFGGSDVNDVLNLIPFLGHSKKADTTRIGMYGRSRGGMMTYLALKKTIQMKAAIIDSGIADATKLTIQRPDMDSVFSQLAPGYRQNKDSVLRTRSAYFWADEICKTTPLLLLAGSADWRVTLDEQMKMVSKLYELKHPVRFSLFEGGQHNLQEYMPEVNFMMKAFFDTYVRDLKTWPSLEPHGD